MTPAITLPPHDTRSFTSSRQIHPITDNENAGMPECRNIVMSSHRTTSLQRPTYAKPPPPDHKKMTDAQMCPTSRIPLDTPERHQRDPYVPALRIVHKSRLSFLKRRSPIRRPQARRAIVAWASITKVANGTASITTLSDRI